jgi:hypothetical protein
MRRAWAAISGGVFLLGLAWIAWDEYFDWPWVFVLLCATSLVRSVLYARWGCAFQAALWGGGLAYHFVNPQTSLFVLILVILGGSAVISGLLSLLPRRDPPDDPPFHPPGGGDIIDAEVAPGPSGGDRPLLR